MRRSRGLLAALLAAVPFLCAAQVSAAPPTPELAREIREGRRPMPDHLRELKKKGPPKLRGARSAGKAIRDLKAADRKENGALWSLPAPGSVPTGTTGSLQEAAAPVTGNVKVLTLLVDFADFPSSEADWYFDDLVYQDAHPSLSHYYREVSGNALTVVAVDPDDPSDVGWYPSDLGWLSLPGTLAEYRSNLRSLLVDAVAAADGAVDFSQYDGDGDGLVDYLILVHAGTGGEWTGSNDDIWSQTLGVAPVETGDDAAAGGKVKIDTFMTVPEYGVKSAVRTQMTIGVYAHEFGHLLGLPDLYDYGLESKGVGNWDLMSYGMWNGAARTGESPSWVSAWGRVALGWVVPQAPAVDTPGVIFTPVEAGGDVHYVWNHGVANEEFFLLENRLRQLGSYDYSIPGNGLLIWHVDETMPDNSSSIPNPAPPPGNKHRDCDWPAHYKVALQQADGWMELEMPPTGAFDDNFGDTADPYPFGTIARNFSLSTTPNSGSYANCGSLVAVLNITRSGVDITADLQVVGTDERPVADAAATTLDEDTSVAITLTGSDPDSDPLTFEVKTLPAHGTLSGTVPDLTYTPHENYFGEDGFTFVVNDGYTDSAPATVSITVTPVSDPPTLATVGGKSVAEADLLAFALAGSDPDGDALTYSAPAGLPPGATLGEAGGAFSWVPGYDQAGYHLVTFRVSDGVLFAEETITIEVTNTNRAPQIVPVGDRQVVEGSQLSFTVLATDPDGDAVSLAADGPLPAGASFDPESGEFLWTPQLYASGVWTVTFRAVDGGTPQLPADETVTITVLDPPGAVFSDSFTDIPGSKSDWTVVSGGWAWSSAQGALFATSLTARNLALVAGLDPVGMPLGVGVIRATVTLTSRAGPGGPNGMIVFGYQDPGHYRWVVVTPQDIRIGQTGTLDGIATGLKKKVVVPQAVGKPATFTIKVRPSGWVQVFKGSATKAVASYRFLTPTDPPAPSVVYGGVGLGSLKARTVFDNVKVWEDSALAP